MARYIKRKGKQLGLYEVGSFQYHATRDDIEDLLDSVPYRDSYAVIITGTYSRIYPGKESEKTISLSYSLETQSMLDALGDQEVEDAADWINYLIYEEGEGYWFEVETVAIIARGFE